MLRVEKTAFISYRRADLPLALLVFKDLTQHGYDVFIDYDGIASGDFERVILDNIKARAHFLVVLTPSALERCSEPGDWLRREIEAAIEARRNIVPLMLPGFDFSSPAVNRKLTGALLALNKYNGLPVPYAYFDEAMERLRRKHLSVPLEAVLLPASPAALQAAKAQQEAAATAPPVDRTAYLHGAQRSLAKWRWLGGAAIVAVGAGVIFIGVPLLEPDAAKQTSLGNDYYLGRNGVSQSDSEAVKWYRKAAEKGYAAAQFNLALMHEQGRGGLPKSYTEAVNWYRKAAEQGYADAQYNLALMYTEGHGGLAQSDTEAVNWFRKAAAQQNAPAQASLGFMYESARGGLPKSDSEAVNWYRRAAEQGNATGQANLAEMVERGRGGLNSSKADAIKLYRLAAEQGNDTAKKALTRLGEQ